MDIIGFPKHIIFNDGKVYSKIYKRYLKHHIDKDGYKYVCLSFNKKKKFMKVHRLVALHFVENPNNLETVDHIDRDKNNNLYSNLRWADRQTQCDNRNVKSATGEKYIYIDKRGYYNLYRKGYFKKSFPINSTTLEEVITIRNNLLS
jgi:hypothetical protein